MDNSYSQVNFASMKAVPLFFALLIATFYSPVIYVIRVKQFVAGFIPYRPGANATHAYFLDSKGMRV